MTLHTDRLTLRPLLHSDVPALISLWTDPEVTRYMGGPRDAAQLREGIEEDLNVSPPEAQNLWPVVLRGGGALVGHCGLLEKDVDGQPEIELVYVIARAFWGQGYATEIGAALRDAAFGVRGGVYQNRATADGTHPRRLIAIIHPENDASRRVAQRLGFAYERDIERVDEAGVTHRKELWMCELNPRLHVPAAPG